MDLLFLRNFGHPFDRRLLVVISRKSGIFEKCEGNRRKMFGDFSSIFDFHHPPKKAKIPSFPL